MRATLFQVLAANIFIALVSTECPNGWVSFEGSCYVHPRSALTFQEAEEFCRHEGAHLVHVETPVENTFLKSYLSDSRENIHWIGLRDEIIEGLWIWYDTNTATNFTPWANGEPNGGHNQNCVVFSKDDGYNWADDTCSALHSPLCEKRHAKE